MLKLIVLLSATVLTLAAPTVKDISSETTSNVKDLPVLNDKSDENKDSASSHEVPDNVKKELNPDDSPEIKEILDKLDESDIKEVVKEEMALKASVDSMIIPEVKKSDDGMIIPEVKKSDDGMIIPEVKKIDDGMIIPEVKKSDDTAQTPTKVEVEDSDGKPSTTMLKEADSNNYIKKITEDTNKRLQDVASAVADVVTSLPIPAKPDGLNKYSEVIGNFVSDLLQIPMLLLHAVSNAISTLTNNKVNIPTSLPATTPSPLVL